MSTLFWCALMSYFVPSINEQYSRVFTADQPWKHCAFNDNVFLILKKQLACLGHASTFPMFTVPVSQTDAWQRYQERWSSSFLKLSDVKNYIDKQVCYCWRNIPTVAVLYLMDQWKLKVLVVGMTPYWQNEDLHEKGRLYLTLYSAMSFTLKKKPSMRYCV